MRQQQRALRLDMAAVDAKTAARLLASYMPVAGAWAALYPHVEREELLATAQVAILEGYLSHNAKKSKESTWIRKIMWWRMEEFAARQPWDSRIEAIDAEQVVNGANPEVQFWQATAVKAIARLTPRHQMIVDGRMKGETYEEIAEQLGITHQRVHVEARKAFLLLRSILSEPEMGQE